MRMLMAIVRSCGGVLRGLQLNLLRRPRSRREALQRLAVVGLMVLAGVGAFLVGPDRADVADVADESFLAQRQELADARTELALLRDDEEVPPVEIEVLETRVDELQDATFLGYIARDGDAPRAGALVPDFRLLDLEGRPVQLSALGRPAIVNFWASWCGFCIEEMPDFERLHQAAGDRVTVIGVNRAEPLHTAQLFAKHTGATYTLLLDLDDTLGRPYQIIGMPTTLYVRADGIVDTVKIGFHTFEEMTALTNRLLDEELALDLAPIDESFGVRARDLLDSQTANHAVAAELFDRLAADPSLAGGCRLAAQRHRAGADLGHQLRDLARAEPARCRRRPQRRRRGRVRPLADRRRPAGHRREAGGCRSHRARHRSLPRRGGSVRGRRGKPARRSGASRWRVTAGAVRRRLIRGRSSTREAWPGRIFAERHADHPQILSRGAQPPMRLGSGLRLAHRALDLRATPGAGPCR